MMILLVLSVAGVAVKLAARFPWLMRLARIISRGGKLEELEDIRQGVRAMKEAESVRPEPRPAPRPEPEPPPKEQKPALNTQAIQKWKDSLKTQAPKGPDTEAGRFQIRNCGDKEYLVKGGGEQVWADGINVDDGILQEAKYIGNADRSPYVPDSNFPDEVRGQVNKKFEEEFERYAAVIKDSDTPVTGLEIITNEPRALSYFQSLMQKYGIPGNVVVRP